MTDEQETEGRNALGSWLSGPKSAHPDGATSAKYPGERLGLPESGSGSMAPFARRLGALLVDWAGANLVVLLLTHGSPRYGSPNFSWLVLAVFGLQVWLLTWSAGASFGQRLLKMRVVGLDGRRVGLGRAGLRTLLICLAVPPLIWDRDGRGMHDRAVHTSVVRS